MVEAALSDAVRRGAQLYGAVNCFSCKGHGAMQLGDASDLGTRHGMTPGHLCRRQIMYPMSRLIQFEVSQRCSLHTGMKLQPSI